MIIDDIKLFFNDVSKEMKKVTWPTREQLRESTIVVGSDLCVDFGLCILGGCRHEFDYEFHLQQVLTMGTVVPAQTPKWYALRTYTGHEAKVKTALEQEIKRYPHLEGKIINVIIPEETVFEVRNGKRRQRVKNFLPGYIMIEVALDKKVHDVITSLQGVVGFLAANAKSEPQALQPDEVARILGRVEERKDVATIEHAFQIGDPIKVIEGPFSNFSGSVKEVNNEKQKLKVEVGILGRRTPVELDFDQVEIERPQ